MRVDRVLLAAFVLACLTACEQPTAPTPPIRSVRVVAAEHRVIPESVVLIGQIRARDEISLAFRIDGKLIDRTVGPGDRIDVGRLVARLDSQNEHNALQGAEADIAAAQAALAQAEKLEARQSDLLKRNITSRALYDQALQQLQTAQAQLESAQARHRTNQNRLKFTELETQVGGIVTAKGAEPGEFVRAGQMIVKVAREDTKDAVFEVPAQLALSHRIPMDPIIHVALVDKPSIKTTGRIREVSPQADPVTRLFPVKVGLDNPPLEFFLGVTVSGAINLDTSPIMALPLTAIIESDGKPSVWVVNPATNTVALRAVEILRYEPSTVIIANGLRDGEVVVTAGVNVLHPGQKVKLLSGAS
jgi:membrane fusion protein, multidrug efflux system